MKKLLLSVSILSLLLMAASGQKAQAQDVTVSYQDFYDELAPYGQWVYDPQYGNVWVPNEDDNFRPYGTRGHWVMTDYGNTWVSQDPWGWACYHYGRWSYDSYYGWYWVPGYEWAPAWVSWRYGGGYSGWAPLGPGVSISVGYNCPVSWWIFVAPQYMYQPNCISYWRGPSYNGGYVHQTTIINNYYTDNRTHVRYNYGPGRDRVQRDIHQPVQVYRVSQAHRPGRSDVSGSRVSIYRPSVNRNSISNARPKQVMQAPRSFGRAGEAINNGQGRQPAFRQEVERNRNANPGNRQQTEQRQPPDRNDQRQQPQRQQPQRSEPDRQVPQRNEQEPQRQQPQRYEPQRQQPQRPEPQRQQPQRQQPQRPEPQRQQPQRTQPAPQPQRQQPQRTQPAPHNNQQPGSAGGRR